MRNDRGFNLFRKAMRGSADIMRNQMGLVTMTAAERIKARAEAKFGEYQPSIGPYPEWDPLKPETVRKKQHYGAAGDEPLIGYAPNKMWNVPLRDSIQIKSNGLTIAIGSDDPLMPIHEFGVPDKNIPPRPVLYPAAYEEEEVIRASAMEAVRKSFEGGRANG